MRKLLVTLSLTMLAACQGNITQLSSDALATDANIAPLAAFAALPAHAYASKVKNILTGATLTDAELTQLDQNPNALGGLIASWQKSPTYAPKMIKFLSQAFQQSQPAASNFAAQGVAIDAGTIGAVPSALLLGNLHELMARTVLAADAEGQPFNTAMSTSTFMLTPPLAAYYTYLDGVVTDDAGAVRAQPSSSFASLVSQFTAQDFNTWRAVTIRQPKGTEATTAVTDTATLKTGTTLVLHTPRTGFFTTPTFFAQWPTNLSNSARVTTNQTMIVALGKAMDGTDSMPPASLAALDSNHAAPGSACYSCHMDLDPMRQFFRQAYTISFSAQNNPNQIALPGMFAHDGVSVAGKTIYDLGTQLANHPSLPAAWVQKLCTYADDMPCSPSDPEFVRISEEFSRSQSYSGLVQTLFTSPLVTYAARTATFDASGPSFPVTKTDHLCAMLSTRLNIDDVCGQAAGAAPTGSMATLQLIASILPANGYSRGQIAPVLANTPTLFFRSGMENVCAILAAQVVGSSASSAFSTSDPNAAVSAMVTGLMGIEPARASVPAGILIAHYNAAVATGAAPSDALESTFVAACLSPSVVGIAQ